MAPKKKQKKNKKVINKKAPTNKKVSNNNQKNSKDYTPIFTRIISTILAKPFFLINLVINRVIVLAKIYAYYYLIYSSKP